MSALDELRENGFVLIHEFLKNAEVDSVIEQLEKVGETGIGDKRFLDKEWCRVLSHVVRLRLLKNRLLYLASVPVLCTYFDKTPDANWGAPSDRDVSIPVLKRLDVNGWSRWTEWQQIPHVNPPASVSRQMLIVRLNIDECDASTSALKVAPGSHRHDDCVRATTRCHGPRGSALIVSPLLVRSPAKAPHHKPSAGDCRVLQYAFGPSALPDGLAWYYKA